MTFNDYQKAAARTAAMTKDPALVLAVFGLGLAGEAGEVIDHLKKHVGHDHELDREKVAKELGDVLWYVAAIATSLGLELDQVVAANVEKLRKRYPDGFSSEASRSRTE
jgi:NTP pyrophosphatase (non-canonical NTP hydrolase)